MGEKQDVLVVGAGVFGLTAGLAFARAGRQVLLVDQASTAGAGASGGLVGALSPYMPENWNQRKAAQLRALSAAPAYWAGVLAAGGVESGYGQTGRWVPLTTPREAELAPQRGGWAVDLWRDAGRWDVAAALPDWLNPAAAPFGAVFETLTARIDPRRACDALLAAFQATGGVFQGGVTVLATETGAVETDSGCMSADLIVLTTGSMQWPASPEMRSVKGQAALLAGGLPPNSASLYADGVYIITHCDGRVAIGSTSEETYDDATSTDGQLDALLARAYALCPSLTDQPVVERWAGLRPRGPKPEPMIGWLEPGVLLATGGFRTGLALAPLIADVLVTMAAGGRPDMPPHYHMADHLIYRKG